MIFCPPAGGLFCPPKNRKNSIFRRRSKIIDHVIENVVTFDDENDKLFLNNKATTTLSANDTTATKSTTSSSSSSVFVKSLLDIDVSIVQDDDSSIQCIETVASFSPSNSSSSTIDEDQNEIVPSSYADMEKHLKTYSTRGDGSRSDDADGEITTHTPFTSPVKNNGTTRKQHNVFKKTTSVSKKKAPFMSPILENFQQSTMPPTPFTIRSPTGPLHAIGTIAGGMNMPIPFISPPRGSMSTGVQMPSDNILLMTRESGWYPESQATSHQDDNHGSEINLDDMIANYDIDFPYSSVTDEEEDDEASLELDEIFEIGKGKGSPRAAQKPFLAAAQKAKLQRVALKVDNAAGHGDLNLIDVKKEKASPKSKPSIPGSRQCRLIRRELNDIAKAHNIIMDFIDKELACHEIEDEAIEALGIAAVQVGVHAEHDDDHGTSTSTCPPSVAHAIMNSDEFLVMAAKHYFGKFHDTVGYGFFVTYSPILRSTIQKMRNSLLLPTGQPKYYDDEYTYLRALCESSESKGSGNPLESVQDLVGSLCHTSFRIALGTLEFAGLRHAPIISMLPFCDDDHDNNKNKNGH